jgi:hypothetical protein
MGTLADQEALAAAALAHPSTAGAVAVERRLCSLALAGLPAP